MAKRLVSALRSLTEQIFCIQVVCLFAYVSLDVFEVAHNSELSLRARQRVKKNIALYLQRRLPTAIGISSIPRLVVVIRDFH